LILRIIANNYLSNLLYLRTSVRNRPTGDRLEFFTCNEDRCVTPKSCNRTTNNE